ncbi:helix-turn-helix domain-containing protein [Flavitalea sp.]|nr:helix-turn-helix transcriptional regulator [Flavitalea sp.]
MLQLTTGKYLGSNKRSWDADGVLISETEYHSKVFEGWHYHDNVHITLIVQGGNMEQRESRESEATAGQILFYTGGELHRNFNTLHPSRNINMEIHDRFFSAYDIAKPTLNSTALNQARAKFTLLKTYRECLTNDEHSPTAIHALLIHFLSVTPVDNLEASQPQWAKTVTAIINDRWNENISLEELSRLADVHPVTISKCFPKYFFCTLGEYIRKIRIEKATALIRQSHRSLTDIAYECGFFDQSHFIRVFKQTTGFLPNRYKKI